MDILTLAKSHLKEQGARTPDSTTLANFTVEAVGKLREIARTADEWYEAEEITLEVREFLEKWGIKYSGNNHPASF